MPIPKAVGRWNKAGLNRLTRHIAPWMPGLGVVVHRGRRSGRCYETPVNVFPDGSGYLFALTYGPDTDWVKNVLATGGCELRTRGSDNTALAAACPATQNWLITSRPGQSARSRRSVSAVTGNRGCEQVRRMSDLRGVGFAFLTPVAVTRGTTTEGGAARPVLGAMLAEPVQGRFTLPAGRGAITCPARPTVRRTAVGDLDAANGVLSSG